ncbi:SIMPL domain-containing protein [Mycolicibacterium tusciae]|uniref:SIMPL domain-containing protein n=1 Tax=Mycolicibacterium tusciae TaxID=75922 RepID=UPI00024A3668|nr:SIMPL domain-containing protein [Mycolicibacterium tusciae]
MSTEITVRGAFSAFRPAERGTVHSTVAYEGPQMAPVYDRVATDLALLKSSIVALEEQGAVTWWSADQLHTWSTRPWNDEGKKLPLVHHATVGVEVKFGDFAALSRWVGEHDGAVEGFGCRGSSGH